MPDSLTPSLPGRLLMTTDAVGGVWRYSLDLARRMPNPVVLAVLGPMLSGSQRDEAMGLRVVETGLPLDWTADSPSALGAATAELRRLAEREKACSVHLHAPALVGARRWPVPVVTVAHSCVGTWWAAVRGGKLPPDLAWRAEATRAGLHTADAIIVPTKAHADAARHAYGDLKMTVVHNGTADFLPAISSKQPSILTAGRLWDEGKNALALDRAARSLNVPVRAAGPVAGPNGARIELPNLQLLGTLVPDAMRRAYVDSSVFISLARYEPFGLSVLEAAQAGMRLVLSDIASFRELWDGVARFVPLDADPVPALRAALADIGDSGAAARAGRYTLEKMVAGTLAVHRRVRLPA